jgi:hypothetical protein
VLVFPTEPIGTTFNTGAALVLPLNREVQNWKGMERSQILKVLVYYRLAKGASEVWK